MPFDGRKSHSVILTEPARQVKKAETVARRQLLGDHDAAVDLAFTLHPAPGRPAAPPPLPAGTAQGGRLNKVADCYRALSPRRLAITGPPGSGKTVLTVGLILGLLENPAEGEAVPVRISAAFLDTEAIGPDTVDKRLITRLRQACRLKESTARTLVERRLVIPVIDGLDEMDPEEQLGCDRRAGRVIGALNAYQDGRTKATAVVACRIVHYRKLKELRVWVEDGAGDRLAG